MKRTWPIIFLIFFGCHQKEKSLLLKDYFDTRSISKVRMYNYQGTFLLNESQLKDFKRDLGNSKPIDQSLKLGAIGFMIFYNQDSCMIYSNSTSSFLECPASLFRTREEKDKTTWESRYFSSNGSNYQNYKPTK